MSNRNTPTSVNRLNTKTVRSSNTTPAATKLTPSAILRRQIVARTNLPTPVAIRKSTPLKHKESLENNVLNTAFSCMQSNTKKSLMATTSAPTSATNRFKQRSAVLNAYYTPSSLYRKDNKITNSNNNLRANNNTPQQTTSHNGVTKTPSTTSIHSDDERNTEISNLTVAVRVRPLNAQECSRATVTNIVRAPNEHELTVYAGTTATADGAVTHSFTYDHVFYSCDPENKQYAGQKTVFEATALPLIERAFEGYNACLFAYGQTGSGKSYSMMGIEALDDAALDGKAPHAEAGIIPRFCYELFQRIDSLKSRLQAEIEVSYFEIYNEKIHDLLCVAQAAAASASTDGSSSNSVTSTHSALQRHALKVREHPIWGPYVVDLSVHPVDSYEALRNWLAVGNSQRATAATGMNDKSSRSHSIFNILLNLTELNDSPETSDTDIEGSTATVTIRQTRRSKISLVDLAGSERISAAGANCERIREGVSINKSLLTLGKVIAALSDAKKNTTTAQPFVPYRESVLTWLLRENLGGNSRTVMLATISPASIHVDETLATLRYACQARTIVNRVRVNESPHDKTIRELRAEVDRLKSLCNEHERQKRLSSNTNPAPRKIIIETSVNETEVEALRQQLAERERELNRAQKSWMERLKEAEDQRKSELRLLKRKGLALELSAEQRQQACLVNLAADPILSGTLFYILPPGAVKIGRTRTSEYCSQPDIVLDGPLVAYHHCIIENENGQLHVTPENSDFETFLNGELVLSRQQMYHGDRLVIGGSHYFRISNPFCTQSQGITNKSLVDFQLAHQEILHKQEEKLRRELEEEKRAALSRIERERLDNERKFKERLQKLELEQLKFQCNSEILETERKALEEETATQRAELNEVLTYTPSFKSTLLEDIERIMQHPSKESLHKTQLMVKEATQRCRSCGLKLEFRQSQVMDEFGMLHAVVLILDKENERKAEWPTARLGVWLDILRDNDNVTATNIFNSVDIEWEPFALDALNETLSDSANSSKISLNLSIVKEVMLKQPLQKVAKFFNATSIETVTPNTKCISSQKSKSSTQQRLSKSALLNSLNRRTKKMLTYDDVEDDGETKKQQPQMIQKSPKSPLRLNTSYISSTPNNRSMSASPSLSLSAAKAENFALIAATHVRDMQRAALKLRKLCERTEAERENQPTAQSIRSGVDDVDNILQNMRLCLESQIFTEHENLSPTKTPKSVRFLID